LIEKGLGFFNLTLPSPFMERRKARIFYSRKTGQAKIER
jgi:hypothetical protein